MTMNAAKRTIAKGLVDPRRTPVETALKESHEAAGSQLRVRGRSIDRYAYTELDVRQNGLGLPDGIGPDRREPPPPATTVVDPTLLLGSRSVDVVFRQALKQLAT